MPGKQSVYGAPLKAKVALAAARGDRTTAQLASQSSIQTSQVTAWKKQLMAQVAELFADGRQRRPDQATDEQELFEISDDWETDRAHRNMEARCPASDNTDLHERCCFIDLVKHHDTVMP